MIKILILKSIQFYQLFISPNLRKVCRFYPSCSEYAEQTIEKYGTLAGFWKGIKRILKCHPWYPGGIDLP